jgi:hypothetical protein
MKCKFKELQMPNNPIFDETLLVLETYGETSRISPRFIAPDKAVVYYCFPGDRPDEKREFKCDRDTYQKWWIEACRLIRKNWHNIEFASIDD